MSVVHLRLNEGLYSTTRLQSLTSARTAPCVREWLLLVLAGVTAAVASTFLDLGLRIPGHAILRVVFPMSIGLALVPRHGAGTAMGCSALLTVVVVRAGGFAGGGPGLGALTSLAATGPALDWTLRHASGGWRQYLAFGLAGLASNSLAFLVRGSAKLLGAENVGARPLSLWLPRAGMTYLVCGLLAGLISGGVWFYARRRNEDFPGDPET